MGEGEKIDAKFADVEIKIMLGRQPILTLLFAVPVIGSFSNFFFCLPWLSQTPFQ